MKGWIGWLAKAFAVAPYIVAGVQQIHKDASTADHATLAAEALGLATGVADAVAPEFQPAADAASKAVAEIIALFMKHSPAPAAAAAPPAPTAS